jgi:GMP synthase (glutamine-hydrolysing)
MNAGAPKPDGLHVALLEHLPQGPSDAYRDLLRDRGVEVTRFVPPAGDGLPDWQGFDGIIVMGALVNALDDARHPWLSAERTWIRDAVSADKPFWGVCLGAQLLASALNGAVRQGPAPEVGVRCIEVLPQAATDPVFRGIGPTFEALQWHEDTFELPIGASLLASSAHYRHQAFVWRRAYGVQFHLEATPQVVRHWGGKPGISPGDVRTVLRELSSSWEQSTALARRLLSSWLEEVVEPVASRQQEVGEQAL